MKYINTPAYLSPIIAGIINSIRDSDFIYVWSALMIYIDAFVVVFTYLAIGPILVGLLNRITNVDFDDKKIQFKVSDQLLKGIPYIIFTLALNNVIYGGEYVSFWNLIYD